MWIGREPERAGSTPESAAQQFPEASPARALSKERGHLGEPPISCF